MPCSPRLRTLVLPLVQAALVGSILLALPFAPPKGGRMLLIPIGPGSTARLLSDAVAGGARLIDRGPIAGSIVVEGQRLRLAAALGSVIILAAPQSGCGSAGGQT